MSDEPAGKWCPYCGTLHARRARACSDWCEKRIRSHRSSVGQTRARTMRNVLAAVHKAARNKANWRDVAMGRNADATLLRIFDIDRLPK